VRIGDTADLGPVVLSAGFGAWRLQPAGGDASGTSFTPTNPRTAGPSDVGGDLRVADYNVLNYFVTFGGQSRGATNPAELAQQQAKIVAGLKALDAGVITLHEIENSAVTTPATPYAAVETLVAALEAADGHDWDYARAHEDGDVITNAIIHRTDVLTPVGDPIAYTSPTFDNARSPIAQTFATVGSGEVFSVVANHLKSKGSACATGNDTSVGGPGNCNADRTAQATELVAFAQQVAQTSGDPDVLLTGDFNSYRFEDPLDVVRGAGYTELGETFAPDEYSYVFDGGSGSLDHAFATASLLPQVTGLTVWETNAVESFAYEYDSGVDPLYAPDPYRASDHNPTVIGLSLDTPATAAVSEPRPFRGDRVTVTGTGFAPGERITATIGGRSVGTATADQQGDVTVSPRVPVLLRAGEQPVVLTGASGETASTSITLRSVLQELIDRFLSLFG
jgi:5'-nucleotidase